MQPSKRPLHILSVIPYDLAPEAGGVKVHAEKLNEALRARGHTVTLLGPASRDIDRPHTVRVSDVFNIPANGADNFLGLAINPLRLRRTLKQIPFDIIHFHEPQMPLISYWVNWLSRGVPKVATFHGYSEEPGLARVRSWSGKLVLNGVREGIAVSEAAKRQARLSYNGPMHIIPNGVDVELFCPQPEPSPARKAKGRKSSKDASGASSETPRQALKVVFVGRLHEPRKGLGIMLEVFKKAKEQNVAIELVLIGNGRHIAPLPKNPHLHQFDELTPPEFAAKLAEADVLVAPAQGQESFGMILIEAMAAGTEVICSDIAGYRAVAEEMAVDIVPPQDADGFVRALKKLAAMDAETRQQRRDALVAFAQRFSWTRLAADIEASYERALAS